MNKKLCVLVLLLIFTSFAFASGKKEQTNSNTVRFALLKGPSSIGFAKLLSNANLQNASAAQSAGDGASTAQTVDGTNFLLDVSIYPSVDVVIPRLLKKEVDVAILPPNVASKIYAQTNGQIVTVAISSLGMLYLLTKDKNLHSLSDLKGKTIYVAGAGATPEYVTKKILDSANLLESVNLDFSIATNDLASAIASGKIDYCVVPEPFASVAETANKNVVRAFDMQELWCTYTKKDVYPMSVIVMTKDFVTKNPKLASFFMALAQDALLWAQNSANANELAQKASQSELGIKQQIILRALPYCGITFLSGDKMQKSLQDFFALFLEYAPNAIGGALPAKDFYFE